VRALARSPQRPRCCARPATRASRATRACSRRDRRSGGVAAAAAQRRRARGRRPEAPLVAGLADACAAAGRVLRPAARRARLEGSKAFSKEVMLAAGVPTAAHAVVETSTTGWRRSPATPR
jgi:phosphoribosylamine--glycine ligase